MKTILILLALVATSTTFAESEPNLDKKTGGSLVYDQIGSDEKYVAITGASAKKLYESMTNVAGSRMEKNWVQKVGTNFTCDRVYDSSTRKTSYSCGTRVDASGAATSGGAG